MYVLKYCQKITINNLILCKNKNNKKYKRQQYSHAKKINGIEIQKKNS